MSKTNKKWNILRTALLECPRNQPGCDFMNLLKFITGRNRKSGLADFDALKIYLEECLTQQLIKKVDGRFYLPFQVSPDVNPGHQKIDAETELRLSEDGNRQPSIRRLADRMETSPEGGNVSVETVLTCGRPLETGPRILAEGGSEPSEAHLMGVQKLLKVEETSQISQYLQDRTQAKRRQNPAANPATKDPTTLKLAKSHSAKSRVVAPSKD